MKSHEEDIIINCSGRRRIFFQVVLTVLALAQTCTLGHLTYVVFPDLRWHSIVAYLSASIFLMNGLLIIEQFVFRIKDRLEHIPWKIAKELFNIVFSISMGVFILTFHTVAMIKIRKIPNSIWGPVYKDIFASINAFSFVFGALNIGFGSFSIFCYQHYCFVHAELKDDAEIFQLHLEDLEEKRAEAYRKKIKTLRRKALVGNIVLKPGTRERYMRKIREDRQRLDDIELEHPRKSSLKTEDLKFNKIEFQYQPEIDFDNDIKYYGPKPRRSTYGIRKSLTQQNATQELGIFSQRGTHRGIMESISEFSRKRR